MQIEEEKAKFLLPLVWIGHKTDIKRLLFLNPENEELKSKKKNANKKLQTDAIEPNATGIIWCRQLNCHTGTGTANGTGGG